VMRELAAITPGDVVHIGGDEAHATPPPAYATFMSRAQRIVASHGKRTRAWHQILDADVQPSTQAQYWGTTDSNPAVAAAGRAGTGLVLSPAHRAYLDMKYTNETALGVTWAGLTEVREAYDWDPLTAVRDVPERAVQGVEAPLWTESVRTMAEVEFMAFPRLPAIAEIGWSPAATHDWAAFRGRLGAHGSRWRAMGIDFYASPQVPWR